MHACKAARMGTSESARQPGKGDEARASLRPAETELDIVHPQSTIWQYVRQYPYQYQASGEVSIG